MDEKPSPKPHQRPAPGNIFRGNVTVGGKTDGQTEYLAEVDRNDIVFAIGPAGTGKTFLAVWKAVEALKSGRVRRIVLVRPAVEAGEKLGFLPGDLAQKIDPYLRPLVERPQHLCRDAGLVGPAGEGKALAAPRDGDIERGLDLAQVLVERAAQVGEALVVDGPERDFDGLQASSPRRE